MGPPTLISRAPAPSESTEALLTSSQALPSTSFEPDLPLVNDPSMLRLIRNAQLNHGKLGNNWDNAIELISSDEENILPSPTVSHAPSPATASPSSTGPKPTPSYHTLVAAGHTQPNSAASVSAVGPTPTIASASLDRQESPEIEEISPPLRPAVTSRVMAQQRPPNLAAHDSPMSDAPLMSSSPTKSMMEPTQKPGTVQPLQSSSNPSTPPPRVFPGSKSRPITSTFNTDHGPNSISAFMHPSPSSPALPTQMDETPDQPAVPAPRPPLEQLRSVTDELNALTALSKPYMVNVLPSLRSSLSGPTQPTPPSTLRGLPPSRTNTTSPRSSIRSTQAPSLIGNVQAFGHKLPDLKRPLDSEKEVIEISSDEEDAPPVSVCGHRTGQQMDEDPIVAIPLTKQQLSIRELLAAAHSKPIVGAKDDSLRSGKLAHSRLAATPSVTLKIANKAARPPNSGSIKPPAVVPGKLRKCEKF
jgi:hypothetical protein